MQGNLDDVTLLQDITEVCRMTVTAFVEERTDKNDQVSCAPIHLTQDALLVLCWVSARSCSNPLLLAWAVRAPVAEHPVPCCVPRLLASGTASGHLL